jgi:hypothetical protein
VQRGLEHVPPSVLLGYGPIEQVELTQEILVEHADDTIEDECRRLEGCEGGGQLAENARCGPRSGD